MDQYPEPSEGGEGAGGEEHEFQLDDIIAADWRIGFPRSIRLLNYIQIAEALQRSTHLRIQDPTALEEANAIEDDYFHSSATDYDYLRKIRKLMELIEDDIKRYQVKLPSLSEEKYSMPIHYFLTNPISKKQMVACFIGDAPHSKDRLILYDRQFFFQSDKGERPKLPGSAQGPFGSLIERNKLISNCLQKLMHCFLDKLNLPRRMDGSRLSKVPFNETLASIITIPIETACNALLAVVEDLTKDLLLLGTQHNDWDIEIASLEKSHSEIILRAVNTFIMSINQPLRALIMECLMKVRNIGRPPYEDGPICKSPRIIPVQEQLLQQPQESQPEGGVRQNLNQSDIDLMDYMSENLDPFW